MRFNATLVVSLIAFPASIFLAVIYQDHMFDLIGAFANVKFLEPKSQNATQLNIDPKSKSRKRKSTPNDILLDGLLASGLDEGSCLSRYQSFLYRKARPYKPSPYLLSKLRAYEDLHKRCGPHTELYNKTLKLLEYSNSSSRMECNYVIWAGRGGMGNRILTMAASFLYAVLTNRVFLVKHDSDMIDLFCEPFPNASWLLPKDSPLMFEAGFNNQNPRTYGNMVKRNMINASTMESPPTFLLFQLAGDSHFHDQLFYCEEDQVGIQKVPWLVLKSDLYFVPSLWLIPSFERELSKMFPDKEVVFHHLGRYLFLPSNRAWGLITRFYQSYLTEADERIGIQVRVFDPASTPLQIFRDQIVACTLKEKLLPEIDTEKSVASPSEDEKSKAILVASLYSEFYQNMTNMYWLNPTKDAEVISVYQPSHEGTQKLGNNMHNLKAWVEMNLLSLSDVLVTSSQSTFGYVAYSLAGLKPWFLHKPENHKLPNPVCTRALSMEPCFHAPPHYDCQAKKDADTGALAPFVKHCEDVPSGLKLFNS